MCKYYVFGLKQRRERQYAFRSYFLHRSNPYKVNEAILVFGDVHGQVNALLFSAATMALFDRPSQPAGSKQGTVPSSVNKDIVKQDTCAIITKTTLNGASVHTL